MTIEIELKFLINDSQIEQIKHQLATYPHRYTAPVMLMNHYFESPDNQLRRWDMGLRIRGKNHQFEMTLKTAGQEIGGLHQRPEYNIALENDQLDISLLPAEVWPVGTDIEQLQAKLMPLFSTDFTREKWLVTYQGSEIEVAFDHGQVKAGMQSLPLQELELELVSGERSDLFDLAIKLAEQGGLRLGWQSKAARGYGLAQGIGLTPLGPFTSLVVPAKANCEQGFESIVSGLLRKWQLQEMHWLQGDSGALDMLKQTLLALRETFTLFGGLIPRQVSSDLRHALLAIDQQLVDSPLAENVCFSADWTAAQLGLTRLLVEKQWQNVINTRQRKRLEGSFKRFCDVMLSRSAAELNQLALEPVIEQQVTVTQMRLEKLILAVYLLSSAYPSAKVEAWLLPWQQAAENLQTQSSAAKLPLSMKPLSPFWLSSNTLSD